MSASNRSVGLKVKRAGIKAWEGKSEQCEEKENVPYIGIFSSNMSRKKCRELLTHGGARVSVTLRAVFVFVSEHLCVWEGVCVCVCEDPLKADTCFEHVVESLRRARVRVSVCMLRGERATQVDDLRRGSST